MMALIRNVMVILVFGYSFAVWAAPTTLTYQGRILKSDGRPLLHNNVSFVFQITDPAGACVIYQEQVDGYDMSNSGGVFDRPIGSGSRSFPASGTFTISDAFNNSAMLSCKGGSTYTPSITDGRKLRVQFYDGNGWNLISPDNVIRSVPYASFADAANKLGSNSAGDFVLKNSVNAGATCDSGNFLTWDASTHSFGCAAVSGASGGTVTNVTSTNAYLSVANGAATPALTVNVGTTVNTVAAGNDARFTDSRPPTGAASGDLGDNYPAPKVIKLQGVDVSATAPTSGQVLKYAGSAWTPTSLAISDVTGLSTYLGGTLLQSQFPASCTASQTLTFLSPSGSFSCTNISVSGSNFAAQTANTVFAGPTSGSAAPTFRALEASDLPSAITNGLWTAAGADVYRASGNVGIGIAAPGNKLHIVDSGNSPLALDRVDASDTYSPALILRRLRSDATAPGAGFGTYSVFALEGFTDNSYPLAAAIGTKWESAQTNDTTSRDSALIFETMADNAKSERMRISSLGYIGIGTTDPQRRLHVRSDGTYQFRIENGSAGGGFWNIGQSDSVFGTGGGKLLFVPNSDVSTAATVVFTNSGNVGIGTTSPTTRLDVAGTVKATAFEGPLTASTNSVGAGSNASPSLTFSGDTDTGFYNTSSNNTISVATGGAKIFDFSSGGLTSPTAGGALITTSAGSAAAPTFSFAGDPDTGWFSPLANTLAAGTGGAERVRIDSSGNVGIGTTAPSANLEIAANSTSTFPTVKINDIESGGYLSLGEGSSGAGQFTPWFLGVVKGSARSVIIDSYVDTAEDTGTTPTMVLRSRASGADVTTRPLLAIRNNTTSVMSILANGNVGIGTTTPATSLHVTGQVMSEIDGGFGRFIARGYSDTAAHGSQLSFDRSRGTAGAQAAVMTGDTLGSVTARGYDGAAQGAGGQISFSAESNFANNDYGTAIRFFTTATGSSTLTERMRISNAGNVGIGTTTPGSMFVVDGSTSNDEVARFINASTTTTGSGSGTLVRIGNTSTSASKPALRFQKLDGAGTTTSYGEFRLNQAGDMEWGTGTTSSGLSTPKMVLSAAGNVGIGTTAPATILDVSASTTAGGIISRSTAALGPSSGGGVAVLTPNIPTAADQRLGLHLFGAYSTGTTIAYGAGIGGWTKNAWTPSDVGAYLTFETADANSTRLERMRIDSNGNVGIGVTDPSFAMGFSPDIRNFAIAGSGAESSASAGSIEIANNRPTATVGDYLGNLDFISANNGAANRKLGARIQSQLVGAGGANGFGADLMFFTKPDNVTFTPTYERMRLTSSGTVLIGATQSYHMDGAISTRVQVHGNTASTGSISLGAWVNNAASPGSLVLSKSRSGTVGTQTIVQNGDALGGIYFNGDDGAGFIRAGLIESQVDGVPGVGDMPGRIVFKTTPDGSASPAERMRITSAGDIGIGTTSPSYKLHVVGTAGLSTGTAWTNASDARLKDIQGDYEYGLSEVLKLHTVRYNYKKDNPLGLPSDFNKTGFIAQEVREVIPDAVTERKDGYLELNVDPIHWAVVNAIKELYQKFIAGEKEAATQARELASVKAEILVRDQKIQKLQQENAAIKSYLCSKDPGAPICP